MTQNADDLVKCHIVQYDKDLLGLPGLIHDDGAIEIFCGDPASRLRIPSGSFAIIQDIRARQAAS